jgi:hypothetical protein
MVDRTAGSGAVLYTRVGGGEVNMNEEMVVNREALCDVRQPP